MKRRDQNNSLVDTIRGGQRLEIRQTPITYVRYDSERDNVPKPCAGTFHKLLGDTPLVKAEKKGTPAFSTALFKKGAIRSNSAVRAITALVFDLDHISRPDFAKIEERTSDFASVVYTSFRHQLDGVDDIRARLVLPITRELNPDEYPKVWQVIYKYLDCLPDDKAKDLARLFFLPICHPERQATAFIKYSDGYAIDVDAALALWEPEPEPQPITLSRPINNQGIIYEGDRNAALFSLAGTMRHKGMSEAAILAALEAENSTRCDPPLPQDEIAAIANSVMRYEEGSTDILKGPLTEAENANRLIQHCGGTTMYVTDIGKWSHFVGDHWSMNNRRRIVEKAKHTIKALREAAKTISDKDIRKQYLKHCRISASKRQLDAMIKLAESDPRVIVEPSQLDEDLYLYNCVNGTIDLKTAKLRPHNPADLITKMSGTEYIQDAQCPTWEAFLDSIFDEDAELIAFIQRAIGYTLLGAIPEQVFFVLYGTGANGKSTFLNVLQAVFGDYSRSTDINTFLQKGNPTIRNDLARLASVRLVTATEPNAGQRLDEALIKQITGGDPITARFLHKEYFEFSPVFTVYLAVNHKPIIRGADHGIWRRIVLVPFLVTFQKDNQDKHLEAKLKKELPGILSWAVKGCLEYQRIGLNPPARVLKATQEYQEEMDVLGDFINCACDVGANLTCPASVLYSRYCQWCEQNNQRPFSRKRFAPMLKERGFHQKRQSAGYCWIGITLKPNMSIAA